MSDCVLLGDKGYLSLAIQINLFETVNISLETPLRSNQKDYKAYLFIFKKSRNPILAIVRPFYGKKKLCQIIRWF